MQEVDAERRIRILRGENVENLPATSEASEGTRRDKPRHDKKRRKLEGEDDTDRDLRIARENNEAASKSSQALAKIAKSSDAPLTDRKGHINLFPVEGSRRNAPKNKEAEAEKAKKKKEHEDQYTMRFSNAAGFKQSVGQTPWYSSVSAAGGSEGVDQAVSKDVWGNEDPRRKEREKMRLVSDDPMATIQKGVTELRQVERERRRWKEERDRELQAMMEAERSQDRKKRHREQDIDDLEGFSLDASATDRAGDQSHRHRHHHRPRDRDRSRDRKKSDKDNRHHRHRSPSKEDRRHRSRQRPHRKEDYERAIRSNSFERTRGKTFDQVPTPPEDIPYKTVT